MGLGEGGVGGGGQGHRPLPPPPAKLQSRQRLEMGYCPAGQQVYENAGGGPPDHGPLVFQQQTWMLRP